MIFYERLPDYDSGNVARDQSREIVNYNKYTKRKICIS